MTSNVSLCYPAETMRTNYFSGLLLFCLVATGCGTSSTNSNVVSNNNTHPAPSNTTAQNNSTAAPVAGHQSIDMASLIGKSRDELKKTIKATPSEDNEDLISWNFPEGMLKANFSDGKQSQISFSFEPGKTGPSKSADFTTPEKLGDLVGVNVHEKTPSSSKGDFVDYGAMEIGGKKIKKIAFIKNSGVFNVLIVHE